MKIVSALASTLLLVGMTNASAAFIQGDIAFGTAIGASWTPADNTLSTGPGITTSNADGIIFNDGINSSTIDEGLVTYVSGDYPAATLGTYTDFNDFVFDPLVSGTQLWTFDSGSNTYSFSISSITIISQTSNTISLEGAGLASITGFDDTAGDFSLTMNQNGQAFSFSSSASVVPIPASVWLFGTGLFGLVAIARRGKTV